jgi:hypothetical protein
MVVTQSGKLVFGPADPPNLAISSNEGASWSPIALPSAPSTGDTLLHPWLWRDPQSSRIFYNIFDTTHYACPDGSGSRLWISDDEGTTWAEAAVGCGSQDWGKLTTGPAFTAANKAALASSGYPNMVYFCAGGPTLIIGPDHFCYRSVDGGKTFARTAGNPVDSNNGQQGYPNSGAINRRHHEMRSFSCSGSSLVRTCSRWNTTLGCSFARLSKASTPVIRSAAVA